MNTLKKTQIYEELREREENLRSIIKERKPKLATAPEGTLHVAVHKATGQAKFYLRTPNSGNGNGTYIRKSNKELIQQLADKKYDQKIIKESERELTAINDFLKKTDGLKYEQIYTKLTESEKSLISPIILDDVAFARTWQSEEYDRKGFKDGYPEHYSNRGERMRSKSEVLIANALDNAGIPYHYEKPLILNSGKIIHPDFTVLNLNTRQEYFWEHLGMMDNTEYALDALNRINEYEWNSIFPGKKLIITHEYSQHPLNTSAIANIIREYLC